MLQLMVMMELLLVDGADRLRKRTDDEGQTAAEYLGIIVVVAVIIGLLATNDIGTKIKDAISAQIDKISSH